MAVVASGSDDGDLFQAGADGGASDRRPPSVSGGEDRRPAGREAAGAGGSSRLDSKAITGTPSIGIPKAELRIIPCKCRSWVCAHCGPGYWAAVGAKITPHLGMFKRPRLLTLTIDRKRFESGHSAYLFVRERIRTFLRLFGFHKAFAVLAFHPNGREWPHWHILVDLSDCEGWVDREGMWELWRDEWGCGGLDLDLGPDKGTAGQAARYAIGYCQHQAGVVADWVLEMNRTPRAYEVFGELRTALRASRGAEEEREESANAEPTEGEEAPKATKRESGRKVRDRLADCGIGSTVLSVKSYPGGTNVYRFMGRLDATPGRLALASHLGELPTLKLVTFARELSNGANVLDVSMPVGDDTPKEAFQKLERAASVLRSRDLAAHPPTAPDPLPPDGPPPAADFVGDGIAPF